jgi:hypothetical protein
MGLLDLEIMDKYRGSVDKGKGIVDRASTISNEIEKVGRVPGELASKLDELCSLGFGIPGVAGIGIGCGDLAAVLDALKNGVMKVVDLVMDAMGYILDVLKDPAKLLRDALYLAKKALSALMGVLAKVPAALERCMDKAGIAALDPVFDGTKSLFAEVSAFSEGCDVDEDVISKRVQDKAGAIAAGAGAVQGGLVGEIADGEEALAAVCGKINNMLANPRSAFSLVAGGGAESALKGMLP